MDLSKLKHSKNNPNYYDVGGFDLSEDMIRKLLFCEELEAAGVEYSSLVIAIKIIANRGFIETEVVSQEPVIIRTFITDKGFQALGFLHGLNIQR